MTTYSKIWKLDVTSFAGVAFGAKHVYGALHSPEDSYIHEGKECAGHRQDYRIERALSAEAAKDLNELNERFGRDYAIDWEAGQSVNQFDTEDDLKRYAVAAWRHVCKDPEAILLSGSIAMVGPMEPLGGPEDIVAELRRIWEYDETETSNQWTAIREEADRQWQAAWEKYDLDVNSHLPHTIGGNHPKPPKTIVLVVGEVDGDLAVISEEEW